MEALLTGFLPAGFVAVQSFDRLASAPELTEALSSMDRTMERLEQLVATLDTEVGPLVASLRGVAQTADRTMASLDTMVGSESALQYELPRLVEQLTAAARSIRVFADYLERHPEALIRGKGGSAR